MSDKSTMDGLAERVRSLQQQQDESAWNEIALIATLSELLPGFSQRFAQHHIAVQKATSPETPEELKKLIESLKKKVQ
jgi:hypothetical protein